MNFITLDVGHQLKSLVDRKDIFQELIENKNKNQYNNILATTLDGSVYQKYLNQTDSDISLSLSLNSDGAPLINSKNSSLWPVLAKIVELPDSIGESFENLIFIGLWLHTEKPAYEIFMSKCVEAITEAVNCPYLKTKGYLIRHFFIFKKSFRFFSTGNLKIDIICQSFIADLPARASYLNVMQFNGYYGCMNCFHPGEYDLNNRKMIYKPLTQSVFIFQIIKGYIAFNDLNSQEEKI